MYRKSEKASLGRYVPVPAVLWLLLPVAVRAQDTPLIAYVAPTGSVTIRRKDNDKVVATMTPAIFEQTWQLRGVGRGSGFATTTSGVQTKGNITAATAGTIIPVETTLLVSGNHLSMNCVLTPEKPVAVNSTQVSVTLNINNYRGTTWASGGQSGMVPLSAKDVQLVAGIKTPLTLGTGDTKISVASPDSTLLLQDNRVFGATDLEIRVGSQGERTLAAGQSETIKVTIDLPGPVSLVKEEPITLKAGTDWIPLNLKLDIAPGSALDFTDLLDTKPVGTYGRVIVRPDGHFGFEKSDLPVRFYGANLCFSGNYLEHDEANRLATRFAALGYNTVRIHHYEMDLVDSSAPDSLTFRKDQLDKLDYLIAAFKKHGVYITTDLFVSRPVKPEEMEGLDDFKAAVLVSAKARDNWKEFTRRLLTHLNPYTQLAYKDDPVIAFISVVNEPNATNYFSGLKGKMNDLFAAEWQAWRKALGKPDAPFPSAIDSTPVGREAGAFITFLHMRAYREMHDFLRNTIQTKALLTDNNGWSEAPALMVARTNLDYVDNHFYWDHPRFLEREWSLPSEGYQDGRSAVNDGGAGPNGLSMTRLYGKPFTVSEFNYVAPNAYRAEGGLLMGAVAALQGWDSIWRFAYSHTHDSIVQPAPIDYFNNASDPLNQASDRAAVLLFRRGDVQTAPDAVVRNMDANGLINGTAAVVPDFSDLTLVSRVGSRVLIGQSMSAVAKDTHELALGAGDSKSALESLKQSGKIPSTNRTDLATATRESETGEILVDGDHGILRLTTPRTVGGVVPVGATLTAGPLTVTASGYRATLWASSLDGKPITQSKHLLLVHLTDIQNNNMRYAAPDRTVLESWGSLPHIARQGTATVTLKHSGRVQVWRLDTAGNRVAPLPVTQNGDMVTLNLSTRAPDGSATIYYEIVQP
jgi:hypothetical protein